MTMHIGNFASFFKERAAVPVYLSARARSEIFDEGYLAIKSGFAKLSEILVEINTFDGNMARVRLLHSAAAGFITRWRKIDCTHGIRCSCSEDVTKLIEAFPFYQGSYYYEWPKTYEQARNWAYSGGPCILVASRKD